MLDHLFIKGVQSYRIVLPHSEISQRRCQVLRVLQLGDFPAGVFHRSARVDQQVDLRVGVGLILFDVKAVGSREQFPVEMAEIVAGHVLAMLGEIRRKSQMRRAMKPADEPSTTERAISSSEFMRASTSGARNLVAI